MEIQKIPIGLYTQTQTHKWSCGVCEWLVYIVYPDSLSHTISLIHSSLQNKYFSCIFLVPGHRLKSATILALCTIAAKYGECFDYVLLRMNV